MSDRSRYVNKDKHQHKKIFEKIEMRRGILNLFFKVLPIDFRNPITKFLKSAYVGIAR